MYISCIKSIKASYKVKSGSKSRMRGISENIEVEREAKKEARKETSRIEAASRLESRAGAAKEQPTRRTRQAVPKRPRASASQGEPSQKKGRKESEAIASAQMPEINSSGTEEQKEEEEEEETASSLRPRGLRDKGPAVWAKEEPTGQFTVVEGHVVAEQPEEVTERVEVEILSQPGVSI